MQERSAVKDSSGVIVGAGHLDFAGIIGEWEAFQTGPDGLPICAMEEADHSLHYRIKGKNALSDQMKGILRDAVSNNAAWSSGGTAGRLWTVAPYVALCTTTPNAASTLASLSPGVEVTGGAYVRKQPTWAVTTASFNNTASLVTWTAGTDITAATTVTGCFLTPAATTTGTAPNTALISFWALNGGNQTVNTGNSLSISYTWTIN
jgi:hypothetical protein